MTKDQPTIYVGIDVSKDKLAVALADGGVRDEVLSLGTFENNPASVDRLLTQLSKRGAPISLPEKPFKISSAYWPDRPGATVKATPGGAAPAHGRSSQASAQNVTAPLAPPA